MIYKTFVWELHGQLLESNFHLYVVVRLPIEVLHDKLFPNKSLPRISHVYNWMKNRERVWMPVIHLTSRSSRNGRDEIIYQYQQGSHTAYCARSFADETSKICVMIRRRDIALLRQLLEPDIFETIAIDDYRRQLNGQN